MIEAIQDFLIQVTLFDYIFFVLTIYFLIQGSRKGFVLSLLSAAKWVLAYILTIYLFPNVKPYFEGILDSEYVLDIIEEVPPPPARICPTLPPNDSSAKAATCVSV